MPKPLASNSTNYWAEIPPILKNNVQDIFSVMEEEGRTVTKVDDGRLILGTLRGTKPSSIKGSDLGLRLVLDVSHEELQDRMMALNEEELAWVKGEDVPIKRINGHSTKSHPNRFLTEPADDPIIEDYVEESPKMATKKKKKKDHLQAISDTFDAIRSERNYSMGDNKLSKQLAEARLSEPPPADFTDEEVKVYRIFERFDIDGDGFLNYQEIRSLISQVKNMSILSLEAYIDMCKTLSEDPALGIQKESLRTLYQTGYSNLDRDYEILFQPFDTRTVMSDTEEFFPSPHGMTPYGHSDIDPLIRAKVTELFARFDSNSDGYWSFNELVEFVTVTDPSRV
jgi:Ca2+-binding EF-hand superfamily protein